MIVPDSLARGVRSAANAMTLGAACAAVLLIPDTARSETSLGVNRIRYVAVTGTPEENCQSLRDVLSSIDDNSSTNRYLVQLEPGTLNCGSLAVILGEGIALAGAGVDHSRIEGAVDSPVLGLIHIDDSSVQLRSLTVRNNVSNPTFGSIGLSIRQVLGGPDITAVHLRDVDIFGNDWSVSASNASFEVWSSYLPSPVSHEKTGDSTPVAFFRYTAVASVGGSAAKACYFCYNPFSGVTLENGCQEPPPPF